MQQHMELTVTNRLEADQEHLVKTSSEVLTSVRWSFKGLMRASRKAKIEFSESKTSL